MKSMWRILALRKIVEKEIDRSNATVPGNDEIGSRIRWRLARSARYPSNPSGITRFLRREEGLIFEIWMCSFYHPAIRSISSRPRNIPAFWVMEYCVFVKDLVDCSATMH